ncbi:BatA domain-containing protein, partial [Candidatus Dependentiae bacterium]|nr:BatA domain-containing protein [Candidatus Dependentiae bacterium]
MLLFWQSPYFLFFLPAIILPVIIHLLQRKKFKKVFFSNMLILSIASSNLAYKLKLYNILNLIIRTLIILLLILYFSKPFISISGESRSNSSNFNFNSYTFFIDLSPSMLTLVPNSEKTVLEHTKDLLSNYITGRENAKTSDKIKFLQFDEHNNYRIIDKKNEKITFINKLEVSNNFNIKSKLNKIISHFSANKNDALIIVTPKFSYSDYNLISDTSSMNIIMCSPSNSGSNAGIRSVNILKKIYSITEPVIINSVLYSNFEHQNFLKIFSITENGKKLVDEFNINLKKGENTVSFKLNLKNFNGKFFYAEIMKDILEIDNGYFFNIDFTEPVNTVLIENSPDSNVTEQLLKSSNYNILSKKNLLSASDFDIKKNGLIFINNLNSIPLSLVQLLKQYVMTGGNLAIIPDETINPNILNDYLGKQYANEEPLLPVFTTGLSENEFFKNPGFSFITQLEKMPVKQCFNSKPYLGSNHENIIFFSNNNPAAVFKEFGKGKIILFFYTHKLKNGSFTLTPDYFFIFNQIMNSIFKSSNIEYTVNSINDYEKFSEVSLNKISNIGTGIYFND